MDNFDFTEEEIEEQLALLGYNNIPKHRLSAFKKGQLNPPYSFLSVCLFSIIHSGLKHRDRSCVHCFMQSWCD